MKKRSGNYEKSKVWKGKTVYAPFSSWYGPRMDRNARPYKNHVVKGVFYDGKWNHAKRGYCLLFDIFDKRTQYVYVDDDWIEEFGWSSPGSSPIMTRNDILRASSGDSCGDSFPDTSTPCSRKAKKGKLSSKHSTRSQSICKTTGPSELNDSQLFETSSLEGSTDEEKSIPSQYLHDVHSTAVTILDAFFEVIKRGNCPIEVYDELQMTQHMRTFHYAVLVLDLSKSTGQFFIRLRLVDALDHSKAYVHTLEYFSNVTSDEPCAEKPASPAVVVNAAVTLLEMCGNNNDDVNSVYDGGHDPSVLSASSLSSVCSTSVAAMASSIITAEISVVKNSLSVPCTARLTDCKLILSGDFMMEFLLEAATNIE